MSDPVMPLSEKARGKQRASDPVEALETFETPDVSLPRNKKELSIRFSEGVQDLIIYVEEGETVPDVKAKIRSQRSELVNRRLRLIYSGRLLTDGTLLYPLITSSEERQVRAEAEGPQSTSLESPGAKSHHTIWLHCSVGPVMEIGDEDTTRQAPQMRPLRGFDRLQAAGFSPEDIASIRRQFHTESINGLGDVDLNGDELDDEARVLEEQWIDSIDSPENVALSEASSTSTTVLQGLLIGFFFPLTPILYFNETRPPAFYENDGLIHRPSSVIFSQSMQMSILLGFVTNILFGIWRYLLSS